MRPRCPTVLIALALAAMAAEADASAISAAKATGHAAPQKPKAKEKPFTLFGSNLIGSLVVEPTHGKAGETIPGLPYHFNFTAPNLPAFEHNVTAPFQGSGQGTVAGQYEGLADLVKHPALPKAPAPARSNPAHASPIPWLPASLKNAPIFSTTTNTPPAPPPAEPVAEAQIIVIPEPSPLALAGLVLAGWIARRLARVGGIR